MSELFYKNFDQKDRFTSSWSFKEAFGIRLWNIVWWVLFRPTPRFLRYWRVFLLKIFGAKISWNVFIYSSAKIYVPWLLEMGQRSCLGPYSEVYNLGPVTIKSAVTVSQYAYICNGTHDLQNKRLPLMIGKIIIDSDVFIGAKAFIMPGVKIGEAAVIGACSVVTKDVQSFSIVGGNPAKHLKTRIFKEE